MDLQAEPTLTRRILQPLFTGAVATLAVTALFRVLFRMQGKTFRDHPIWTGAAAVSAAVSGGVVGRLLMPLGPFMRLRRADFFSDTPDESEMLRRRLILGDGHSSWVGSELISVWRVALNQEEISIQEAPLARWHELISHMEEGDGKTFLREEVSRLGRSIATPDRYSLLLARRHGAFGDFHLLRDLTGETTIGELVARVGQVQEREEIPAVVRWLGDLFRTPGIEVGEDDGELQLFYDSLNLSDATVPRSLTLAEVGIRNGFLFLTR